MDLLIAWRNLWRNPRRTVIILTAIVIGIVSMLVLSAFGRGSMEGLVNNSLDNLVGHIKILHSRYRLDPVIDNRLIHSDELITKLRPQIPQTAMIIQRLRTEGVLSTSREHFGVEIVGIEAEREQGASFIGKPVFHGEMISSVDQNGLVIGEALLEKIGLEVGKKVVLLTQHRDGESSSRAFRIRGTFRTELKEIEKRYVFANLASIREMTGTEGDATEISIVLSGGMNYRSEKIAVFVELLSRELEPMGYRVFSWRQLLPVIDAYIEMFDAYMLIWFIVVFIAMGFGLANTMLMAVYERMREFGLQRALGMRSSRIVRVVLIEVLLLLLIGMLIANVSTLFILEVLLSNGIDLSVFAEGIEMWGISRIVYPVLAPGDIINANGVVIVLGLLVGLYPALQAARFTPIETMRHL